MSLQMWNRISRVFFMTTIAMAIILVFQTRAQAATCKVAFEDVGTIIGKGATKNLAFEDAAVQCFDKKAAKAKRNLKAINEDAGLDIIDVCANVVCQG